MLPVGFDESVLRVTEGLNREGSGIITESDILRAFVANPTPQPTA